MKVYELFEKVSFKEVEKELLITNNKLRTILPLMRMYFEVLLQRNVHFPSEGELVIEHESFQRSFVVFPKGEKKSSAFFTSSDDYLNAEVGKWEQNNIKPALLVASVLYGLTEEGRCFTEEDRILFASELHQISLEIKKAG